MIGKMMKKRGLLRRVTPVSRVFGLDRGLPIDRFYIESFLEKHARSIQGCVLEIGEPVYTCKFGGGRVAASHVLSVEPGNPAATLTGDLETGEGVPKKMFDCAVLTQTLPFIYDVKAALTHCHAALKPGGVLLATFPGISQISRYDMDRWCDYWRFTDASAAKLFGDVFGGEQVTVATHGNVLAACAFLHGLASGELKPRELDHHDPDYQVLIGVRAVKK
ncbi:Methyltransferase [Candidatus Desulfarcum epimagneticum]|uniref:Methyltransferase n=1 Tax=uncultured Desulfobacteraceae bacterium TaxID=218296 RepID=A0A484HJW2_9BACT|nr:Methyltransferase [uncultured Desulfobacteraceae bacterium]